MTKPAPAAFLSYVREADPDGRITRLKERLQSEVRVAGIPQFEIYQDIKDINWGERWQDSVDAAVSASTVLIPVIVPAYFQSEWCRRELEQFIEVERQRGRRDTIFPVLWVRTPGLAPDSDDRLKCEIANRSYVDWTDHRFEDLSAPAPARALGRMAEQLAARLLGGSSAPSAAQAVVPPVPPPRSAVDVRPLADLFVSLFSADELRRFLRYGRGTSSIVDRLPGPTASLSALASEAVDLLVRDGRVDQALFNALLEERPGRQRDIDRVRGPLLQALGLG